MWEDEVRIPPPGYRSGPQRRAAESRRMVVAAGAVGAVLLLCAIGYFTAKGGGSEGVPVIQAPPGLLKVKPDDPGGLQVSAQTSALLGNSGSAGGANFAPAPEAPDPAALVAAANQEQAPPPARKVPAPSAASPAVVSSTPTIHSNPMAAVPVPTVPETPAPTAPKHTALNVPPSAPVAGAQNLAQEVNPPAPPQEHGHVRVQLAALASQDAALREWERLAHRMPTLFEGRRPIFTEARVSGHTFWRVRTAGFASVPDAARFCSDVRARGAACTVALF